ncbi:MAG: FtsX-like permease family protein [Dehalococcoidia bacterium]|nr:FtsX-like permease family protein [Dehalococcoidia bacterium]MDD5493158.1 FtsX-like permease family protein [Dehalococcoidia bacterium]
MRNMWNDFQSSLFLFYKYVTRGNKVTLTLTILMATLAFIQINIVHGILSGAVNLIYSQTKSNYVGNIVIQPGKDQWGNKEQYITQVERLKRKINAIPGIIGCSARYSTGAIIEYDPDKTGKDIRSISWPVKSINPQDEMRISELHNCMLAGQYLDESDRDQVIMGREVSGGYGASLEVQSLKGVNIGDEVTVFYHNGVVRKYTVKGIYATVFPLADMTIFVTQKEMESVLGLRDRASEIIIRTDEAYPEAYYIEDLRKAGVELQDIRPWQDFIGLVLGIVQSFDIIKKIILFIGLIVAGVTIFIVIFIATISRRKQIGIMKAIGMKESIIVTSYILLALFYATIGISLGMAIIEFILKPYFIAHPLVFPMGKVSLLIVRSEFLTSIASMIAVSIVAGLIPSWQVSRENIIKAIWG